MLNTPKLVATPLPPLNLRKTEKSCPSMQQRPTIPCPDISSPEYQASQAAPVPFRKSPASVSKAGSLPVVLRTLVAPMLPLPDCLKSIPLVFAIKRPVGIDPNRNEHAARS